MATLDHPQFQLLLKMAQDTLAANCNGTLQPAGVPAAGPSGPLQPALVGTSNNKRGRDPSSSEGEVCSVRSLGKSTKGDARQRPPARLGPCCSLQPLPSGSCTPCLQASKRVCRPGIPPAASAFHVPDRPSPPLRNDDKVGAAAAAAAATPAGSSVTFTTAGAAAAAAAAMSSSLRLESRRRKGDAAVHQPRGPLTNALPVCFSHAGGPLRVSTWGEPHLEM